MPWRGAVEVAGLPLNIALHPMKRSRRTDSFKNLAPNGFPPVTPTTVTDTDGNEIPKDALGKGVKVGKQFFPLSDQVVEQIKSYAEKTQVIEAKSFAPVDTIPLEQALMSYWVTPDEKVIGSDRSVNVLWNGLRHTGLAYIAQVTLSGSMDSVLAMWANDDGLFAATLPFAVELYPRPQVAFTQNAAAGQMFAAMVEEFEVAPLDLSAYTSEYKARRDEAIEMALAGQEIVVPAAPAPVADAPDLMAVMEKMLASKGQGKVAKTAPKAAARPRKKVA